MRLDSSLEIYVELERPITIENQKNLYDTSKTSKTGIPIKTSGGRIQLWSALRYHMIKPPPTNRYKQLVKSTNRP
jgi:hypothetical protein